MRTCGAKVLSYASATVGDVVMIQWTDGAVTVLREGGEGEAKRVVTAISAECLGKMDELRGRFNPDEVALAATTDAGVGAARWEHHDGGTIDLRTSTVTHKKVPTTPTATRAKKK